MLTRLSSCRTRIAFRRQCRPPSLLMMLANTSAGGAYTMAEYRQMVDAAGFGASNVVNAYPARS